MNDEDSLLLNRRRLLYAALVGGGGTALAACTRTGTPDETDLWAGFDERITERTLAEAEKLFGLQFTESERRLMLGGPVEEDEEGYFKEQLASLAKRRQQNLPNSAPPATTFDPRLPGVSYPAQDNAVALYPEEIGDIPADTAPAHTT